MLLVIAIHQQVIAQIVIAIIKALIAILMIVVRLTGQAKLKRVAYHFGTKTAFQMTLNPTCIILRPKN